MAGFAVSSPALLAAAGLTGYAVGALSPSVAIGRIVGVDVRRVGSGNPGATNVGRTLGVRLGVLVGVLDIAKGAVPAAAFGAAAHAAGLLAGLCAVLGHVTSPLLRGRGGKGAATTAGAVLGSFPLWAPYVVLCWFLVLALTRWVALASVCAVGAVVAIAVLDGAEPPTLLWAVALAVIVIDRHRINFRRSGARPGGGREARRTPGVGRDSRRRWRARDSAGRGPVAQDLGAQDLGAQDSAARDAARRESAGQGGSTHVRSTDTPGS